MPTKTGLPATTKVLLRDRVLAAIRDRGPVGLTCDEAEQLLYLSHQSCSARVNDLMRAGTIVKATVQRKTRSGKFATVWIAPEYKEGNV